MRVWYLATAMAAMLMPIAAHAQTQEITTYTYDALGRVTQVDQQGGRNDNTHASYQYDAAGNRSRVTVTCPPGTGALNACAGFQAAAGRFVVVPLNGYSLIPIG